MSLSERTIFEGSGSSIEMPCERVKLLCSSKLLDIDKWRKNKKQQIKQEYLDEHNEFVKKHPFWAFISRFKHLTLEEAEQNPKKIYHWEAIGLNEALQEVDDFTFEKQYNRCKLLIEFAKEATTMRVTASDYDWMRP